MKFTILVTGAAGYIGSHTVLELLNSNYDVICIDNLCNAYCKPGDKIPESLKRVKEITGKSLTYYNVDVRDRNGLKEIFQKHKIDCVAHFAALKAVGESCLKPLEYYQNNITGTSVLLETMLEMNVFRFLFSSSATVYGDPKKLPIPEDHPTGNCTNPYGKSKYFVEEILKDLSKSDDRWEIISLRYFNPVGAHSSGKIGEDPNGEPNNLMPYIAQVAVGRRSHLNIYGSDYSTHDGTGVRDYLHVVDLAIGHVYALNHMIKEKIKGFTVFNLGTGTGYSVLDVINAFSKASNKQIDYKFVERRQGDIAESYADPAFAHKILGWRAERDLKQMCEDSWRWQKMNPNGFNNN